MEFLLLAPTLRLRFNFVVFENIWNRRVRIVVRKSWLQKEVKTEWNGTLNLNKVSRAIKFNSNSVLES